ncbi:MAG: glycosyltransferase family 1 protein [Acidobacteria bacterium]|nr:MAG: glycosyltransferase family 1 protein [Acidobacteriota bacterium]
MRVLMISRAMVAASQRARLRELAELGVRLTVVAPDRWEYQKFESDRCDAYELLEGRVRLGSTWLGRLSNHTFYYQGISKVIRREPWDLIHIEEEPFNFSSYHAAGLVRNATVPIVFSTWQNMMKRYPPPFLQFEKYLFRRAAGALPGTAEALEVLHRRGFLKPTAVIPIASVDPALYRKQDAGHFRRDLGLGTSFAIGFLGRITREKGLETLVKAFAMLPQNCILVLAGSGPFESELHNLIQNLGIEGRVRRIPWMKSGDVSQYMNSIDALVLPSLTCRNWKEQFGRVLIEAMACETCVVGSDSGEIPNVIGDAGLVFHEGDEGELADRLRRLMEGPSLRESMGQRGRERVLERFTHEKIAQRTLAFYQRILAGPAREPLEETVTIPTGL